MEKKQSEIRLIIEIKNDDPIELLDLTKSFYSLANEFTSYVSKTGDNIINREAKLYVKEIRSGSVICELVEIATIGVIPFVENINTVVGFGEYLSRAYKYFLGKGKDKPKEIAQSDLKELSQILNPIAKDSGSQMNVSTTINGNVTLHINLSSTEANAVQNVIGREIEKSKIPDTDDQIKHRLVLTWYQARNDLKATAGNKGIIEDISKKPMNIIFENDDIKEKMLHGNDNPFNVAFVVDVKLQTIKGNLAAYKVIAFHDSFTIE